jgi:hypothetical protein
MVNDLGADKFFDPDKDVICGWNSLEVNLLVQNSVSSMILRRL